MILAGMFAGKNLIKFIAWAAAFLIVAGLIIWGISLLVTYGEEKGEATANAKWEKKHAKDLATKVDNIKLLREVIRNRELDFAEANTKQQAAHKEDIRNVEHGKDMLIDAIMAGTIKLHLHGKNTGNRDGANGGGNDGKATTGATVTGDNGASRCELNPETTQALYGITGDGDAAITQLGKAQEYIRNIYKQCSGLPPPPWMITTPP